jgi:acyl-CoA dehydrogenase
LYKGLIGAEKRILWGATWFTEVQGGSDLGANTTTAKPRGGKYELYGYKYFASGAGIADAALTTARLPESKAGAKGLSLFLVPRVNSRGELNYYVRRLKWKSGTVPVPTGEVEFIGSEAYLLGEADKGIYYTLEDLMVSRLANSIGALGIARKAYLEAYGYASVRRAFGKRLVEHKLALRDLLDMEADIEASTALTLYAISLFDSAWGSRPPYNEKYHYARLMTHIAKNVTAETAAAVTQLAMELLGGIGFLHEFAVERWHREALITPIWEGTSNIQALDMLEAMYKKGAHQSLLEAMEELVSSSPDPKLAEAAFDVIRRAVEKALSNPLDAEYYAKDILRSMGRASAVILLLDAARHTGDALFEAVARYYYETRIAHSHEKPLGMEEAREIASLRGALDEVDWEAKARNALQLKI